MALSIVLIILFGSIGAARAVRDLDPQEKRYALISVALHVVGSFAHWAIIEFYYGVNDARAYYDCGIQLARLLDDDFAHFAPEVLKLLLHRETALPFEAWGNGSSTGTMSALAGLCLFVTGSSLLSMYVTTTWFAWFGQLCLYRVAREELPSTDRPAALLGFLIVPSVVFWGSGFDKEAFVLGFFGILVLSTQRLFRHRRLPQLIGVAFGGIGVAMIKSYTLFAYVLAVSAFIYAERAWRTSGPLRIRPAYLILAGATAIGGIALMGRVFPEFGADKVAETIAQNQGGWRDNTRGLDSGGSNVDFGSGDATTVSGQLRFVPVAIVNAFFRPLIFEARGGPMIGAAIESTFVTLAALSLLGARRRAAARDALLRSPILVSSVVFCIVFGIGVGLATGNLGTLSRYRVPMMPFYVTTILVLRGRSEELVGITRIRARALLDSRRSRAVERI